MSGVMGGGIENPGGGTATAADFTFNASTGSISLVAGNNITFNSNASTITIDGPTVPAVTLGTQSLSAGANSVTGSAVSLALVAGNSISLQTATAAGRLTVTVDGPTIVTSNFTLNGSTNSVSLVAGAGIGLASNLSTITISSTGSKVASIGADGSLSSGNITLSGVNLTVSSNGASVVQLSVAAPPAAATQSLSAGANSVTGTGVSLALAAGANITLATATAAGALTVSIAGGAGAAAGTQSLSAGANSVSGSGVSLALFAGNNIGLSTATGAGSLSVTFSNSLQQATRMSFTQNVPLQAAGLLTSTAGTITGPSGYGSSLFLQRIWLEAPMNLSEADLAMGISFPATSQGAGTISRSLVLYSFGNSTSLASVLSVSGTSAWSTGTSTTAGAASLTLFQGGWAGTNLVPMTFASTSVSGGEYVVGNLINFAQGSSTWSLSLYGQNAAAQATTALVTGIGTSTTSYYSSIASLAVTNVEAGITFASSTASSTANWRNMNAIARTLLTATTTTGNNVTSVSGLTQTVTVLSVSTLPTFGFIGTGSTTSAFQFWFSAGIMSTGAVPAAISLTGAGVTYSGSTALIQPWFALAGA